MVGFNAADYLLDRHVRGGDGGRTAVVTPARTLTYAELADTVHRVAGGLAALGVRPEERVMLCMVDGLELLTGILGAMYAGAVPVPVSTMVTGQELGKVLADSRARVLCVSAEFTTAAKEAVALAPEVAEVVLDRANPLDFPGVVTHDWSELSTSDPVLPFDTWEDSPALWLYTSGTTGEPKGAMHRHASIRAVCETYGRQVLGIRDDDRCFSVAKLFFAYGIGNSAFFPLSVGACSVLEPGRPTPQAVADRVRRERPTLFFGVPTFYSALLASDVPDNTFYSVRQAVSAGEPLPAVLFERFRARFGVEILDGIGSTEALHIFLSNRPGAVVPGTTGTAVPGYDVEIRDTLGVPIEAIGEPGELFVRGPSTAFGYWSRYETSKRVFQGDWLRTGDSYVRNPDGTYTCLGRFNDMLKAGGIWVSPSEVEQRLLQHPDVAEVAVVAAPDEDGIDKPVACVVPVAGRAVEPDALIEFCREGLASFKRPRAVVAVHELPKTATGKIRRNVIREQVRDSLRPGALA
ncbi:benzoate-CoA ligase family protein [Amycolatopsis acidiphila]|uniref:Benzoate-CoA ligase family protein n=1 Tax=Amycolatopsis acidiphila TaxID=715473 RepID=A0A558A2P8_9PSEU|nr:benzoate-CoA ligase family protein [Amycolatopsis acidiphila]TVT18534.1 benzoate-CoA ligase family protein [Amycolatopsis acidiphila]UIJ59388.1 benzoate-CoA ligase family protein [Amycolatopsis acidiphila]GHG80033.1 benzoate--CoA ligase [Amycolatopsis acidiphila]